MLAGNSALFQAGGAYGGTLDHCTLTNNSAPSGGGAKDSTLNNCIVYFNCGGNYSGSTLNHCYTTPLPTRGVGNIAGDPRSVHTNNWSNLRLLFDSPCINARNNTCMTTATDLDGRPRIVGGKVDMGVYEYGEMPTLLTSPKTQTMETGSTGGTSGDGYGRSDVGLRGRVMTE